MKTVIIASENPVKLQATKFAFEAVFPGETFSFLVEKVDSGVADQPMSDEETLQGALNRLDVISKKPADFWVALEGGAQDRDGEIWTFAWAAIREGNKTGKARSATFQLPTSITRLLAEGKELGEATDMVFSLKNSKQTLGTVGVLTNGAIDRAALYRQPVILALAAIVHPSYRG